jgi:hypothetical protein
MPKMVDTVSTATWRMNLEKHKALCVGQRFVHLQSALPIRVCCPTCLRRKELPIAVQVRVYHLGLHGGREFLVRHFLTNLTLNSG